MHTVNCDNTQVDAELRGCSTFPDPRLPSFPMISTSPRGRLRHGVHHLPVPFRAPLRFLRREPHLLYVHVVQYSIDPVQLHHGPGLTPVRLLGISRLSFAYSFTLSPKTPFTPFTQLFVSLTPGLIPLTLLFWFYLAHSVPKIYAPLLELTSIASLPCRCHLRRRLLDLRT